MPSYGDPAFIALLLGTIVLFTFLFDLVDMRPLVGSFAFVGTRTYLVYVLFRVLLAVAASALIVATQPNTQPILVGLVAVLGGVVLLQGLALNIAGENVVDLAGLVGRYKQTMAKEAADQRARLLNQAGSDTELARRTLATLIVQANPEYARRMLERRQAAQIVG